MLNGAIIGCGTIYRTHAEAILEIPDARLAGVCDVDETALAAATKHYGCAGYTDYKELLQAPDVDVVPIDSDSSV